jgi:hypothetical protein
LEADVKRNYDPRHWEPFDRDIEASLIRIYGLKWIEERMWMDGDRLWRLKGRWSRERSVYAGAATGKIELDILFPAAESVIDKDRTKDQIAARVTRWLKSVPKEAALPQKRWLSIRSVC